MAALQGVPNPSTGWEFPMGDRGMGDVSQPRNAQPGKLESTIWRSRNDAQERATRNINGHQWALAVDVGQTARHPIAGNGHCSQNGVVGDGIKVPVFAPLIGDRSGILRHRLGQVRGSPMSNSAILQNFLGSHNVAF